MVTAPVGTEKALVGNCVCANRNPADCPTYAGDSSVTVWHRVCQRSSEVDIRERQG